MEQARAVLPAIPLFQDLYFCTAGRSVCCPGHSFGPDVRLNYLIHYILNGRGVFETDQHQYNLHQGQGFLIEPGQTTRYQADDRDPWTYIWIGFNGTLAAQIMKSLNLGKSDPIFSCPAAEDLDKIIKELLCLESEEAAHSLDQHVLLLAFFHLLAKNLAQEPEHSRSNEKGNYHIDRALEFIRANYSNQIHVADLANYLGISRYHLFRLFQDSLGQSPQEYISAFCLGRARELLTTTSFSVREIAMLCGYSNAEVFSKAFKKKYLAAPIQYRRYSQEHPGVNPAELISRNKNREG